MTHERLPHDPAYKQFFSNSEMVESLLKDFVSEDFVKDLDFSTLERCSGSYVTDELRERHDDIIWRVGWKERSWCYVVLLLEFQSTPDPWMALRVLSYTSLLLLDLVKTGKVKEGEGLPPVLPIVIYNGNRIWKAPQEVAELFAPMPPSLKAYRPTQRHFLLDESQLTVDTDQENTGLANYLFQLEQAENIEQIRPIIKNLIVRLQEPKYLQLRRAFTVWLNRVVFKRAELDDNLPEFQDLQEVDAMLEERATQWKEQYIQQGVVMGRAEGMNLGRAEGINLGRAEGINLGRA